VATAVTPVDETSTPLWRGPVATAAAVVAGTAVVALGNPDTTHVPLCPLKFATGLDCPLCGSLRAVHALSHGHLGEAFDHNVLVTAALPAVVVIWAMWLRESLAGRPFARIPDRALFGVLAVLAAFAVARNLPALDWLASEA
jgi:hypothetical protein